MEFVNCTAGYAFDASTLGGVAGLAMTTFAWTAHRLIKRRHAERTRSVQVVERLHQYRVPSPVREWDVSDSSRLAGELAYEDRAVAQWPTADSAIGRELVSSSAR